MNLILSPWRGGTPRRLARALNLKLLTPKEVPGRGTIRPRFLLNWGCITTCNIASVVPLNYPTIVKVASNKLTTFRTLLQNNFPTLEFTESEEQARGWLKTTSVIGHFDLHGHSGEGLMIFRKGTEISAEEASKIELYTRYFPKKKEVRIHVVKVDADSYKHMYLEKKRVTDPAKKKELGLDPDEVPSTFIRTHNNGWIYAREVEEDKELSTLGINAIRTLGLHWGAVDILVRDGEARIGEINTAPGLQGKALDFYVSSLKQLMETYRYAN